LVSHRPIRFRSSGCTDNSLDAQSLWSWPFLCAFIYESRWFRGFPCFGSHYTCGVLQGTILVYLDSSWRRRQSANMEWRKACSTCSKTEKTLLLLVYISCKNRKPIYKCRRGEKLLRDHSTVRTYPFYVMDYCFHNLLVLEWCLHL